MTTIVVIAPGEMGAAVGRRLTERGARVVTSLAGRSAESAARAKAAGMVAIETDTGLVSEASFILSIVPPDQAIALAQRIKAALDHTTNKPIYIDCNAIAPRTVEWVGTIIASSGCGFIDAGIIGPPVGPGRTKFYLSGPAAKDAEPLAALGLDLAVLKGPIGNASALKMSYAGITKGLTAIGAAMMQGAARGGSAEALRKELLESQPHLFAQIARSVTRLPAAAYRWHPEMQEIAAFLDGDEVAQGIYWAIAGFFDRMAKATVEDPITAERDADALAALFADPAKPSDKPAAKAPGKA